METGSSPHTLTRTEQQRLKECTKALLLERSALRPRLGRFALLRQIGRGAHGVVYAASDVETGDVVALKTLRRASASGVLGLKQEFRALADIVHENLVQLHELFVEEDEWYFTMELVSGVDFTAHVRSEESTEGHVDLTRLRRAFGALASGVHAIHAAGKLHCDLKPSNVRVTDAGRVVVLDYGLVSAGAVTASEPAEVPSTGEGQWRGTPEYLAPELLAGGAPSRAGDVYALGVMLFVALTGKLPFAGRTAAALERKQHAEPPRARSAAPGVPQDLDELCAAMLARDPQLRPALAELFRQLGVDVAPTVKSPQLQSTTSRFVGRSIELAELHAALDHARAARPVVVFVSGPSGIGKTSLVERFAEQLRDRSLVLTGRCYEREAMPFKAFDGIVDALVRRLGLLDRSEVEALAPTHLHALLSVFPALGDVPGFDAVRGDVLCVNRQELRQQAFAALKQLLRRLSREQPVVLIVDDLQWADLDSARLLLELLGPPAAPALLYVGCHRSEDTHESDFLRELLAPSSMLDPRSWERRILSLGALEPSACSTLAHQLLAGRIADSESAAARIANEAAGVPLFVYELARHALSAPSDASGTPSINALLGARISALEPSALQALSLLALAARPVTSAVLARALAPQQRWQASLRTLELEGLVRRDANEAFVADHQHLRELTLGQLPPTERATLHEALAHAYEQGSSADPEWLLGHWQAAGKPARAIHYAIAAAGAAASKLAFDRAAALYRSALQLGDGRDPRRSELYAQLGEALGNAGRSEEAADAFLSAAAGADPEAALALRCSAAQQRLRGKDVEAGTALVRQVLEEVGVAYPRSGLALVLQLLWSRVVLALRSAPILARWPRAGRVRRERIGDLRLMLHDYAVHEPLRGLLLQNVFSADALYVGDAVPVFVGIAWDAFNRSFFAGSRGQRGNAKRLARLERSAAGLDTPYVQASVAMVRSAVALFEGRYADAEAPAVLAQTIFVEQCEGALWEESMCSSLRYTVIEMAGPISRLSDQVPVMLRRATERGDHPSDATIAMAMTLALLARDEPVRARETIEKRRAELPPASALQRLFANNRLMDCMRYCGENVNAWQRLEELWPGYLRSPYRWVELTRIMMHHQRARCAVAMTAERWDEALAGVAEREARAVLRIGRSESRALAAATRAALAWQRGEAELARTELSLAAQAAATAGIGAYADCYRRQLGWITPGTLGEQMVAEADSGLCEQGIVNPERWVEVYAPGFNRATAPRGGLLDRP